jgi:hypothetical protein
MQISTDDYQATHEKKTDKLARPKLTTETNILNTINNISNEKAIENLRQRRATHCERVQCEYTTHNL